MNVFLPIRPVYAERILRGEKLVEFRRRRFARKVKRVLVYSSSPVKRIQGYFTVMRLDSGAPTDIWRRHRMHGGISRSDFLDYYAGCNTAYAYVIEAVWAFDPPVSPTDAFGDFSIPQSFKYLTDADCEQLLTLGVRTKQQQAHDQDGGLCRCCVSAETG